MKISFKPYVYYDTEDKKYKVEVCLSLPANEKKKLKDELVEINVKIFNEPLYPVWGMGDIEGGVRYKSIVLEDDNQEMLKKKYKKLVEDTVKILREVVDKNRKLMKEVIELNDINIEL